jgi:hypothetical protein
MYNKLTQAHKRPMSSKEQFGLVIFVLKFILSKFGIFIIFLSLNLGSGGYPPIEKKIISFSGNTSLDGNTSITEKERLIPSYELFSKLKMYCIIATIVTLFLNPQQTKYFGGLAVVLKQAGFFSKYGKSEKTVYILSWILIALFAQLSYQTSESLMLTIANPKPGIGGPTMPSTGLG